MEMEEMIVRDRASARKRAQELVSQMTLEEKA